MKYFSSYSAIIHFKDNVGCRKNSGPIQNLEILLNYMLRVKKYKIISPFHLHPVTHHSQVKIK